MIRPHPTYPRSQRKQEYGSNYYFSQFSSKNYILLSVGTPNLSDTSLVVEVPRNPAPLRRCNSQWGPDAQTQATEDTHLASKAA